MSATLPPPSRRKRNDGKSLAFSFLLSVAIAASAAVLPTPAIGGKPDHVFLLVNAGEQAVEPATGTVISVPEERQEWREKPPEQERREKPSGTEIAEKSSALTVPESAAPEAAAFGRIPRKPVSKEQPSRTPRPSPAVSATPGGAEGTRGVRRRARRSGGFQVVYPYESRLRGETGVVLVAVGIAADGRCLSAEIAHSSGYPGLDRAALDTVLQSGFEPATLDGVPIASEEKMEIAFELE